MRRQKLIWFAMGAGACAFATVLAALTSPKPASERTFLVVYDAGYSEDEVANFEAVATNSARLVRNCGANEFYFEPSVPVDALPYTRIEIKADNTEVILCAIERAREQGHSISLQFRED